MGRSITPIPFPLSKGQAGIWLAHHMAPGCTFYTIAQYTDLDGPIDVAVFEGAARQVIAETETLRLRFAETPDGPVQWIEAGLAADWTLPVHDLSGEADPEPAARRLTRTLLGQPFDLTSDAPLFRWHLIRTGTRRWIWFQAYHHIVLDGLGLALVKARLAEVYSASLRNEPARGQAFVPLRELLGSPGYGPGTTAWEEDRAHWLALLAGQPETVSLAGGGVGWERDFRRETCVVPQGITDALATLGKSLGATLPAMLAAAVAIYVGRLAGRSETLLGWQVTGRFDAAARRAPAMLSNTVPLRLATAPGDRLAGVVRDAAQQTRSALGHQRYAHETLRRDLGLEPIAADMFGTLVNVSSVERASLFGTTQGLTYNLSNGPVRDLSIVCYEAASAGMRVDLDGNTELYTAAELSRHGRRLLRLFDAIAGASPDTCLSELPLLDDAERADLDGLGSGAVAPPYRAVTSLIAAQVAARPEAPAVRAADGTELSHADLWAWSGAIAARLARLGDLRGKPIGLAAERGPGLIAGLLGILRMGGIVLPLDPTQPPSRLAQILAEAGPVAVLADARVRPSLPPGDLPILSLDAASAGATVASLVDPGSEELAYLLYTSGSTGTPKGVAMGHGALSNLVQWQLELSAATGAGRTLQFTPPTFDVAFQEILSTLAAGGCLVVIDDTARRDPHHLLRQLREHTVTRLFLPFVALQALAEAIDGHPALPALREVVTAGEALRATPALRRLFHALPDCVLWNHYGPTETHVATAWRLPADPASWPELPPIGRPIPGATARILDAAGGFLPTGVAGELWLGGVILAAGYWQRPELTAERFVTSGSGRLYRTGDLARWRPDGTLDFLGRSDDQVKIRGYRVEPGEVEASLLSLPGLAQASVQPREIAGETRLVAYLVPHEGEPLPPASELRQALAARLPDYMVPSAYVALDALPLTPNGKINRAALPLPAAAAPGAMHRPPTTEHEALLCRLFAELTGTTPVSVDDSFFALGGTSLAAMRLLARLRTETGRAPPLRQLVQGPTPAALAAAMARDGIVETSFDPLLPFISSGQRRPFFCVPGFGAGAMHLRQLGETLGRERPVFGLNGLPERLPAETLEAIAGCYAEALRRQQPIGPYFLGGFSLGGVIAYEMARQLQAAGAHVGLLAIIDTRWPGWRPSGPALLPTAAAWARNLPLWLYDEGRNFDGRQMRRRIGRKASRLSAIMRKKPLRPGMILDLDRVAPDAHGLLDRQLAAARAYSPRPTQLPIALFQAAVQPISKPCGDPAFGWRAVADASFASYRVPGNHFTMLAQPYVQHLAQAIDAALRRRE